MRHNLPGCSSFSKLKTAPLTSQVCLYADFGYSAISSLPTFFQKHCLNLVFFSCSKECQAATVPFRASLYISVSGYNRSNRMTTAYFKTSTGQCSITGHWILVKAHLWHRHGSIQRFCTHNAPRLPCLRTGSSFIISLSFTTILYFTLSRTTLHSNKMSLRQVC